ncbi:hypothetical protein ANCCEY_02186 [Ancylostoma ceylanicum]|uniref:Uncharacterized protein n=1 Tax=Ancylostoma ceylanicum TaxID=53326 RepID=A0A0D6MCC4_9BILA|nr:hypothetical protein ANCCEY_02186 [Ancylostoma ceylanicum]
MHTQTTYTKNYPIMFNSRARQKKYQGNRKSGEVATDSTRSSEGPVSPSQKSEASSDGMFPSSVTTR